MAMTQAESYADLWAAHRDAARPLSPADVWGLAEDREFQPPSRAHVKRIRRARPEVVPATPRVALDYTRQHQLNEAVRHGNAIAKLLGVTKPIYR